MESKVIKIALLGLGNVGTGVYKVLENQKDLLVKKIGSQVEIKKILVRDKNKKRSDIVNSELITDNWQEIIQDEEIQIIVEVMGGIEPAKTYILEALEAGKNVVTANKDLLAEYGKDLLNMASLHNKDLAFEASVAGGIPIVRPLKQCLAANNIYEIMGIINGTTNYILTKMTYENLDFDKALEEAKKLGYAEADPTADIEGYDAARKIAILASLAFQSRVSFKDVYVEGITKISTADIEYARELGYVIKLVGIARNVNDNIETRVHPMFLPKDHPLASVNDSFNAVFVRGDAVGEAMFFGRGAGELPTASAVVGDIIDIGRNIIHHSTGRISCTCYNNLNIHPISEVETSYYLRMKVKDKPGVMASIASVFGNHDVSLASVIQKHRTQGKAEIVIVTDIVKEKYLQDALQIIKGLSIIEEISAVIRVGDKN
ncbi:MAG: homoserine dehydrogenase [Clostridia bacterium]|mgnify:CR=1 FL=1|jgi:homoserine dehydrogenase|nr:homoserine dehydrogenase [Clostridia bacterium]